MNVEEIRQLAEIMQTYGLERIELGEGAAQVRLHRPAGPVHSAQAEPVLPADRTEEACVQAEQAPSAGRVVTSPMVGVFYSAPAPGADPYIAVGKHLEVGEVLCVVEAMKMMNEITAEFAGKVAAIHVADGDIVEVGQPLLTLI